MKTQLKLALATALGALFAAPVGAFAYGTTEIGLQHTFLGAEAALASVADTSAGTESVLSAFEVARRGSDDRGGDDRGDRDDDNDDDRGRGRGRGRGGDDDRRDNHDSGSGRDKPRIPGGSGCDDAGDILEHPECSG